MLHALGRRLTRRDRIVGSKEIFNLPTRILSLKFCPHRQVMKPPKRRPGLVAVIEADAEEIESKSKGDTCEVEPGVSAQILMLSGVIAESYLEGLTQLEFAAEPQVVRDKITG